MHRRNLLVSMGCAFAPWPGNLRAQNAAKVPYLGMLLYSNPASDPNAESMLKSLRVLGYIEGRTVRHEYRYASGNAERLSGLAAELVQLQPDVLLALGGDVAPFACKATKNIPIVFVISADPVKLGLVDSLAMPGGNATGVTFLQDELASKRLELLKMAAPHVARVAFVWNPNHPDDELFEAQRAAALLNIELQYLPVRGDRDLDDAFRTASTASSDAFYVVSSRQTVASIPRIVDFVTANKLPLVGGWGAWAQAGGLLSYGPDIGEVVQISASYVDRILKGVQPADLPVQAPTRFELIVNLRTARMLGLPMSPTLLAIADKLIE
jgi:putative ABC transport system substrate-binding protein